MALKLLDLPPEVLQAILTNTDPQDLARLCCCRTLNDFIRDNRLLYKELYLKNFDEPTQKPDNGELSWSTELKRLVNFQKILESKDPNLKAAQLQNVAQTTEILLKTAAVGSTPSLNVGFLRKLFESQENINIFLCGSMLFEWAKAEVWGDKATTRLQREIESVSTFLEHVPHSIGVSDSGTIIINNPELADASLQVLADYHEDQRTPHLCLTNVPREDRLSLVTSSGSSYRQLSAKLHCLYGVSIDKIRKGSATSSRYALRSDFAPIHPYARSRVYDLRQHTDHTLWGPFLDDGSLNVDWEKMEAIMIILDHNIKHAREDHREYFECLEAQSQPFVGVTPNSFISPPSSVPVQPPLPLESQDPYNITGTWMRIVCFLDYAELYDFNFNNDEVPEDGQPRRALDTHEAIRVITMKLQVNKITAPGEEDGQGLPVVHFNGTSASHRPHWDPNANSKIKGTVRLTPENEVRWTSFSVYHGEERWRSEGVQIGGVRSARGVLGYWFDKDHDEHGPAGPTAFWKSHDGVEVKKPAARYHPPLSQFTYSLY